MRFMKSNVRLTSSFTLVALFGFASGTEAASFTWDGNGATAPNPNGGTANWAPANVGSLTWWNGTTNVAWNNPATDNEAIFANTTGAVNINGANANTNKLTFTVTGYSLTASATRNLNLNGTTPTISTAASVTASITAPITGSAGLAKTGSGALSLSGSNSYTGVTAINVGSLQAGHANALGSTGAGNGTTVSSGAELFVSDAITLAAESITLNGSGISGAAGALHIGGGTTAGVSGAITLGSNATIKGDGGTTLNLTGGIDNAGHTLTLANDGGANLNLSTAGISGGGGLTKAGGGTATLNTSNSYSGATTISGGTLALGGSADIDSSSAVVLNGGNFNVSAVSGFNIVTGQSLTGNGTVTGDIVVDGTLGIGASTGTITFNDDLVLSLGSTANFEINSFTAGNYDLAVAAAANSQSVTFNGGTLNLLFQSGFNTTGSVEIFDFDSYAGTGFTTVNATGLSSGFTATFDKATGIVTVIPEPYSAMLGSFGFLALLRRRRN